MSHMVHFHCVDEALASKLDFLAADPDEGPEVSKDIHIETTRDDNGFYGLTGAFAGPTGCAGHILERGHAIVRDAMFAEEPLAAIIHGASIVVNGRRFILVADKATGKTTFCLKCLASNLCVEGDEHVAVRANDVIARARTLRVKQGSLGLVPELDEAILASPWVEDWTGDKIYSLAPRTKGKKWCIKAGQADFIVFLRANHGGASNVSTLGHAESFERLTNATFLPEAAKLPAIARLHTLVRASKCAELHLGDLDRAIWHLHQISHKW